MTSLMMQVRVLQINCQKYSLIMQPHIKMYSHLFVIISLL